LDVFKTGLRYGAVSLSAILMVWGAGCAPSVGRVSAPADNLLVVNFEKARPLRYRMVSERKTLIDLMGSAAAQRQQSQTMTERLELVMVYTPVEVDPFGLTKLNVTCESAVVSRTSFSGRKEESDAMESLPQLSFTLTLTPTGLIEDLSDFERVIRELGDRAFATVSPTAGRVKNPDMINDFMAMQWCLWDAVASMDDPAGGLRPGKTWTTRQMLPWPAPLPTPPTRATTFTLDRIAEDEQGTRAHITAAYAMADKPIEDAPRAYEGSFQMRGLFGFLRGYQFTQITGTGEQVFDVDAGVLEKDHQHYTLDVTADFALPLGDSKPVLNVDQTLSIELLK
jgi:hypothetical protein